MAQLEIQIDKKTFKKFFGKLDAATRSQTIIKALFKGGQRLVAFTKLKRFRRGITSGTTHSSLLSTRTGNLINSIGVTKPVKIGEQYVSRFGIVMYPVKYAHVHEFGATIRPGLKGFLAWRDRFSGKFIFTKKPVVIPKRTFLRPAIHDLKTRQSIVNDVAIEINKAIEAV